jgi:hypothetical protein
MTPDEVLQTPIDGDTSDARELAYWLRALVYQLAVMNEREERKSQPCDSHSNYEKVPCALFKGHLGMHRNAAGGLEWL